VAKSDDRYVLRAKEIQAALDMLFVSVRLREDMEEAMWRERHRFPDAPSKFARNYLGRRADPMGIWWTRRRFDEDFQELVRAMLNQCEKVREGKSPDEIYPVNAKIIWYSGGYVVDIFMGSDKAERVEGFKDAGEAKRWIKEKAKEFVVSRGLPKDTAILTIGDFEARYVH
jgi:hypothetical protein